jgi:hypothetical protein
MAVTAFDYTHPLFLGAQVLPENGVGVAAADVSIDQTRFITVHVYVEAALALIEDEENH